jgi:RecA/RadA recombinase
MTGSETGIIVGVLGQWASGKTTAARTLVEHLQREGEVRFLTDRALFAGQAIEHILGLDESKVAISVDDDGRQRFVSELVTVWLNPGEDLETVDPTALHFDPVSDAVMIAWRRQAKVELGRQIRERSAEGMPIVFEAAFGPNTETTGESHYGRTIPDLFARLERAGLEPRRIKWLIVETSQAKRSERNRKRQDKIPAEHWDRLDAVGGNLDPELQARLEQQGTMIKRVPNDHDDLGRFKADVIAAFEEMHG